MENQPVRSMSLWMTTAEMSAGSRSPGHPSISAYRNPWNVNCGSHSSTPSPASVYGRWRRPAKWPAHRARRVRAPRHGGARRRPGGAGDPDPEAADEVLAEVGRVGSARRRDHLENRELSRSRGRRATCAASVRPTPRSWPAPASRRIEISARPARWTPAGVVGLPGIDAARQRRTSRAHAPALAGLEC